MQYLIALFFAGLIAFLIIVAYATEADACAALYHKASEEQMAGNDPPDWVIDQLAACYATRPGGGELPQ